MERWRDADSRQRAQLILNRWNELQNRRAPFLKVWEDVSKYISPFSGRFNINNHGENRSQAFILDSEATHDVKILSSGLMTGASSPAAKWFKIEPGSEQLADDYTVDEWCATVEKVLFKTFHASNTYNTLHQLYVELVLFGTAADIIYEDNEHVIQHHLLTAGEFCVDTNHKGEIDTLYRNFQLSTAQAVKAFGLDILPKEIQTAYHNGELSTYWEFLHAIEPRIDRDYNSKKATDKAWGSYYLAINSSEQNILRESGFDYFPCIVPRWEVLGADAYGTSPAIEQLPDIKQLMQETLRKAELIEHYTEPPVQAPSSARQNPIMLKPGSVNFTTSTGTEQQIRPITQSVGDLNAIVQDIAAIKQSIRQGFFVDLFMIIQQTAGDRRTTVEINALKQEQMLTLGSVMERIQNECLGALVSITTRILYESRRIPPVPLQMQKAGFNAEFTSVLAQAQKAVDINNIDRFTSAMGAAAQLLPEIVDRIDTDGYVDEYRERLGINPRMLRSKDDADKIREQRAQAQQAQQQQSDDMINAQTAEQVAQAQKTGAEASLAMQQLDVLGGGTMI